MVTFFLIKKKVFVFKNIKYLLIMGELYENCGGYDLEVSEVGYLITVFDNDTRLT